MDEVTAQSLLRQARDYVDDDKLLHAIQIYRRLVEEFPDATELWLDSAGVYMQLGRMDVAERTLLAAASVARQPEEVWLMLSRFYLQQGDLYHALVYLRKLRTAEPTLTPRMRVLALHQFALTHRERKDWRLAEHYFRKTHALDPSFPKLQESIAELLLRRGNTLEAIKMLRRALREDPYSWIGHYLLGMALVQSSQLRAALDEFIASIELDPGEPRGWQKTGEVLLALQELDEAEKYLRKALELDPQLTEAMADYGFVCLRKGDPATASRLFTKALQLEPGNPKARRGQREAKRIRPGA